MEAVFALAGVVLGALLTLLIETRQERRHLSLTARLELPAVKSAIWAPQPLSPLREVLGRTRTRAHLLGVDAALVSRLEEVALSCWSESFDDWDESDPVSSGGIEMEKSETLGQAMNDLDRAFGLAARRIWRRPR